MTGLPTGSASKGVWAFAGEVVPKGQAAAAENRGVRVGLSWGMACKALAWEVSGGEALGDESGCYVGVCDIDQDATGGGDRGDSGDSGRVFFGDQYELHDVGDVVSGEWGLGLELVA